ncbi:MAG: type II toxin-antitoxin system Phd/YefM family antitoxin [Chloroflexota bacterium]
MKSISIGEAKSRFSQLISQAASGEHFLIRRRERAAAVLIGLNEWERLERVSQLATQLALALGQKAEVLAQIEQGELHPAMAAFGLWRDEPDLEDLVDQIYRNRQKQISETGVEW